MKRGVKMNNNIDTPHKSRVIFNAPLPTKSLE